MVRAGIYFAFLSKGPMADEGFMQHRFMLPFTGKLLPFADFLFCRAQGCHIFVL